MHGREVGAGRERKRMQFSSPHTSKVPRYFILDRRQRCHLDKGLKNCCGSQSIVSRDIAILYPYCWGSKVCVGMHVGMKEQKQIFLCMIRSYSWLYMPYMKLPLALIDIFFYILVA